MALRRRRFDRFFVLREGVPEPLALEEPVALDATEADQLVLVTEDRSGPETKRTARPVPGTRGEVMEAARRAAKAANDPSRLVIAARPRGARERETVYQEIAGFHVEPESDATPHARFQACRAAPELVRHDTFQGREHLVVPVVMLAEGVIWPSNAPAPELALASEYGNPADAWNGRPVVYRHPQEGTGSANQRPVAERETIGQVFEASLRDDGALVGELWIDLAQAEGVPGALDACRRIEAGEAVEVSTGYFAEQEPAAGTYQGRRYAAVQRSIKPDHLALLSPEETGACSWEDGCGCPRVNRSAARSDGTCPTCGGTVRANVRSSARRPSFDGTESAEWSAPSFSDYVSALSEADDPPSDVESAPAELRRRIAAHTLLGDPEAEGFRDLSFFPVVSPSTGRLNENALDAVISGRGAQADVPAEARESAQRMARRLLRDEFDRDVEVEANVKRFLETLRIQARGGEAEPVQNQLSDEDLRTALLVALERAGAHPVFIVAVFDGQVVYAVDPGGFDPLKTVRRSFTQEGTSVSVGDDEEEVRPVTEFVPAAARRFGAGGEAMTREERIRALVSSERNALGEADRAWLEQVPEERLAVLEGLEPSGEGGGSGEPASPSPEAIDRETLRAAAARQGLEVREPEAAPQSEEEFLRRAPPEMRSFLQNAVSRERERREAMIRSLAENGRHGMSEAQLRALEPSVLESLARMADVPDYSLRGQPRDPEPTPERFAPEPESVFAPSGTNQ